MCSVAGGRQAKMTHGLAGREKALAQRISVASNVWWQTRVRESKTNCEARNMLPCNKGAGRQGGCFKLSPTDRPPSAADKRATMAACHPACACVGAFQVSAPESVATGRMTQLCRGKFFAQLAHMRTRMNTKRSQSQPNRRSCKESQPTAHLHIVESDILQHL